MVSVGHREGKSNRIGILAGLMLGTGAVLLALKQAGAIDATTTYMLAIIPVGLMFATFRALQKANRNSNAASTAAVRYTNGVMASSVAYILGLGIAMWIWRNLEPSVGVTWLLAMLPIVPIFAMIWVMARYLREERDEYLRHRAVIASLVGLGLVLGIGSFWGFLETFELVPHVPGWWSVPIWALGMGVTQCWMNFRDKAGVGE